MGLIYRNRLIINQRGGSIDIDNTTEREKFKISHRSGSNITLTNVMNSELATNNKQTNIVNDSFNTIGGSKTEFVYGNVSIRTCENTYNLKGFKSDAELEAFTNWKIINRGIVDVNSQFKIFRGGISIPNGPNTLKIPKNPAPNPTLKNDLFTVENKFGGYVKGGDGLNKPPIRLHNIDEVVTYTYVIGVGTTTPATDRSLTSDDILQSAGSSGSNAPGVLSVGSEDSCASEGAEFAENDDAININKTIESVQELLTSTEESMGMGGDEIYFTKRNKFEQIGATLNDYPSIRIDPVGRSQPFEVLVCKVGTYKNHDSIPHIEELDNSSSFPCGNDEKIVGNRYTRTIGSGGVNIKTTGTMELGSTQFKLAANRLHMTAKHGVHISSDEFIELQSLKTISIRTDRQVLIESSVGITKNLVVNGGIYSEGEIYCQHITAPLEVHQTEDTIVASRYAVDEDRKLLIGEANIGDEWYPVYALARDDLMISYPHSHHHNGIPMRLTESNSDVRKFAMSEYINDHTTISQSLPQIHERKTAQVALSGE
jgi:hypothetical protein